MQGGTGLTLIDYLQGLRIEEAKCLLEAGERPAEDVSAEVGYGDASFFRRPFRQTTGLSPGQYRRMFGTMPAPSHASR